MSGPSIISSGRATGSGAAPRITIFGGTPEQAKGRERSPQDKGRVQSLYILEYTACSEASFPTVTRTLTTWLASRGRMTVPVFDPPPPSMEDSDSAPVRPLYGASERPVLATRSAGRKRLSSSGIGVSGRCATWARRARLVFLTRDSLSTSMQ